MVNSETYETVDPTPSADTPETPFSGNQIASSEDNKPTAILTGEFVFREEPKSRQEESSERRAKPPRDLFEDSEKYETFAPNPSVEATETGVNGEKNVKRDDQQISTVKDEFDSREEQKEMDKKIEQRQKATQKHVKFSENTNQNGKRKKLRKKQSFDNRLLREERILGCAAFGIALSVFFMCVSSIGAVIAYLEGWEL
ncbi:hypothetical protein L596_030332 [Steinernema carpocapsae]|uniref:Uncharacterized protein n=1 Tax=Steinernema carpocapsae TaxID=34508 RepID=A0A4U5LP25_STECR|nr:hypothetical protein L596_030332 [Steinernema carpocapsae]